MQQFRIPIKPLLDSKLRFDAHWHTAASPEAVPGIITVPGSCEVLSNGVYPCCIPLCQYAACTHSAANHRVLYIV